MELSIILDSIILAVCAIFAIQGLFRGFVYEVMSLLAFVGGYFAVVLFKDAAVKFFENTFGVSGMLGVVLASVILFVLAYVLIKFLEVYLSRFVNIVLLAGLNKIAGMVIGFLKGVVVVLIVVYVIRKQPIFPNLTENLRLNTSAVLPYFELLSTWFTSLYV